MKRSLPNISRHGAIVIMCISTLLVTLLLLNNLFSQSGLIITSTKIHSITKDGINGTLYTQNTIPFSSTSWNTTTARPFPTFTALPPQRKSESLPNPLMHMYPDLPTGTLNMTITVIPIPLKVARSMIPIEYPILTSAYLSLLPPSWSKDSYPLIVESRFDHDIRYHGIQPIADFQNFVALFPFVGRLGVNGGSFAWAGKELISKGVKMAVDGAKGYGVKVGEARFVPNQEAYAFVLGSNRERLLKVFTKDESGAEEQVVELRFVNDYPEQDEDWKDREGGYYGIQFFKNVTNQPFFSNNDSVCDNQIIFYNTTLSTGSNAPVPIRSDIWVSNSWFPGGLGGTGWGDVGQKGAMGIRVDTAFIEKNYLDCELLRNYGG